MLYQRQWQFLKKTVELGKIPHAYLFYGQNPAMTKTLALEFIKLLNCQTEDFQKQPCQTCRHCQDIKKGAFADLILVEPQDKEIQISQIRELNSRFSLSSYNSSFKSAIIYSAHQLNQEAQSAFLKLLEEPKGKTIFILITQYPEMLLPTILSRVERLRFQVLPEKFQKKDDEQEKIIAEVAKISKQNLALRFQYAKRLAEERQNLEEVLDIWLRHFRELLLLAVDNQSSGYSLVKLQKILKTINNINYLIATTNVNPRLALEILMLEL